MATDNPHVRRIAELHRAAQANTAMAQEQRDERDDEIMAAIADGITPTVIASESGVSVTTVYGVQKMAAKVRRRSGHKPT